MLLCVYVFITVSIARRLQDPLAELIKIDPKNIGVGMYQVRTTDDQLVFHLTVIDSGLSDCFALLQGSHSLTILTAADGFCISMASFSRS